MGEMSIRTQPDSGQTPFTEAFKTYVEHLREHFHVPSISIGVIDGDNTYIHSFGDAKVSSEKATEDTLYYIASCTKSFTATTLLSILEDLAGGLNSVDLKTKISSIIPNDFILKDEYATRHATLEDALAHLLGVGPHDFSYGGTDYTLCDAIRSLRHLAMTAELREKHQYLNMGYMVIQHVIETLTGKPIEDSHHKYIWDPLGMDSTFAKLGDAKESKNVLAEAYTWDDLSHELITVQHAEDYPLVGGGGLISSIKDMTKYLRAHIDGTLPLGSLWQDQLYRPRCINSASTNEHESDSLYALGWAVRSYHGKRVVSHNGGITGFGSKLVFLPDQRWGLVILANADAEGFGAVSASAARLMDDFLQIPQAERQDLVLRFDELRKKRVDDFNSTKSRLYPKLPNPSIPLPLPLAEYAGTYYDPGYRIVQLKVAKPLKGTPVADPTTKVLHAGIKRLVNVTIDMEHVSGDFFIAWCDAEVPTLSTKHGERVQFVIGSDGKVQKMGIKMDFFGNSEDDRMVVWFNKVI